MFEHSFLYHILLFLQKDELPCRYVFIIKTLLPALFFRERTNSFRKGSLITIKFPQKDGFVLKPSFPNALFLCKTIYLPLIRALKTNFHENPVGQYDPLRKINTKKPYLHGNIGNLYDLLRKSLELILFFATYYFRKIGFQTSAS